MKIVYLIIGAGFVGCTVAEQIASQLKKRLLTVEKRKSHRWKCL